VSFELEVVELHCALLHGIRIRTTGVKPKPRFYTPAQIQKLVLELSESCRAVVLVAVLTGMRIGEILGLRWKRVDLLRMTLEVAETFSDGDFGTPKTKAVIAFYPSVRVCAKCLKSIFREESRVNPMICSSPLRVALR